MMKIYFGIAILLICSSVNAQYKKASFLNKSGRTYDLGFAGRFVSGRGSTVPGIYYSYGRDKGKKIFHWFDMELLLPTSFKYNTVDKNNAATIVTVTGKAKTGLAYRYNFAYYLTNVENTESKIKPFVTAGINVLIIGGGAGTYDYTPTQTDPEKRVEDSPFNYGCNAGLGGIYTLGEKIGIKMMAGYNLQTNLTNKNYGSDSYTYHTVFSSHPYIGIGIRFLMTGDGE
jgi:hypothetical protein